jgi:glycosyltransferase involved in cell wall biosynthesis
VLVGRLSPRKGTDVALEAVALLRQAGRDVRLTLCGSVFAGYEWFEDQLRARAAEADLAGGVELVGYADPWEWFARADVVVVPSRVEPFGNVAVQAMLAGRPVVASRTQGLAEIVRDGETGLLVPPDDPAALAGALAELLGDPSRAAALAQAGRRDAAERFGAQRYREQMGRLLVGRRAVVRGVGG